VEITLGDIGEILAAIFAFIAIISAWRIGKEQNKINEQIFKMQDNVELYILSTFITLKDHTGVNADKQVPVLLIRNLSASVIYLEKYLFNAQEHLLYDEVLPPVSHYDGFHYVYLPQEERLIPHVTFEIFFADWQHRKWHAKGNVSFSDGQWKFTYTPCQKISVN
jgi:hypothetical protein